MRWRDIRLVYKLSLAFGVIFLLFGLYTVYNFKVIGDISGVSDDLDRSSESELTLLKAENAHFIWAANVAAYLLDDTVTRLNVVTDGHQCTFGKWFYGEGREELEQRLPAVAPILDALEQPHLALHAAVPGIVAAHEKGDVQGMQRLYREGIATNLLLIREGLTKAIKLVDEDTNAFNKIMDAFSLPKKSEEEKAARQKAVQDATRYATEVPFKTMKQCYECMSVAKAMAEIGNPNSVTDAGVGALAARAGVMGAFLNVKINAAGLEDKEFAAQIIREGEAIVEKANELEAEILKIVNSKI